MSEATFLMECFPYFQQDFQQGFSVGFLGTADYTDYAEILDAQAHELTLIGLAREGGKKDNESPVFSKDFQQDFQ